MKLSQKGREREQRVKKNKTVIRTTSIIHNLKLYTKHMEIENQK